VEEAYVNTMGTLPMAAEEDYFDDDPSETSMQKTTLGLI
jgi:hypothetical protein